MKVSDRDKKDWFSFRDKSHRVLNEIELNSGWKNITLEGDVLKVIKSRDMHLYDTCNGSIGYNASTGVIVIHSKYGIFDYSILNNKVKVIIAFYNSDGELIKSERTRFRVWNSQPSYAHCYKSKINDEIQDYLHHQSGYVRIVAEKYHSIEFDLKVPCMY